VRVRHGPAAVRGDAPPPRCHWPQGREGGGGGSPESEDLTLAEIRSPRGRRKRAPPSLVSCGGGGDEEAADQPRAATETPSQADTGPAENATAILVTTDCGADVVLEKTAVDPGQTALQALDRVAAIETEDGGLFVTAIEGVEQDTDAQLAWLYYVNGVAAEKGAAEITLEEGDVEWWDLHDWETTCEVPAEAE
jgi:hypothetical protein